jgi:hypothetical protein
LGEVAPVLLDPRGVFGGITFALEGGERFAFLGAQGTDDLGGTAAVGSVAGDLALAVARAGLRGAAGLVLARRLAVLACLGGLLALACLRCLGLAGLLLALARLLPLLRLTVVGLLLARLLSVGLLTLSVLRLSLGLGVGEGLLQGGLGLGQGLGSGGRLLTGLLLVAGLLLAGLLVLPGLLGGLLARLLFSRLWLLLARILAGLRLLGVWGGVLLGGLVSRLIRFLRRRFVLTGLLR